MPNLTSSSINPFSIADAIADSGGVLKAAAIRKEYSQLRKTAQKRLSRFEGTEWMNSSVYRAYSTKFKRLDEIKSAEELAHLLVDVRLFLELPTGSISGLKKARAQSIATLHERGYTFVNASNSATFTRFMDKMRSAGIARIFDSERLAELAAEAAEEGVSADELSEAFTRFVKNEQSAGRGNRLSQKSTEQLQKGVDINANNRKSTRKAAGRRGNG